MNYQTLVLDVEEGVLTVTLSRPEQLNAFTVTMADELVEVFDRASDDDTVRAIIVTGAGRAFCAGMDLTSGGNVFGLDESLSPGLGDMRQRLHDPEISSGVRDTGGRVTLAIFACKKPVIAAINGPAVGIGATMTLAMDARLASTARKDRLRLRQNWDHSGGVFKLVPAPHCRDFAGVGVDVQRRDHHCGRGAALWPRSRRGAGRPSSRRCDGLGPPMDPGAFTGSGRDDPADDVSQLGPATPTDGAPDRIIVDVLHQHRGRKRRRQRISQKREPAFASAASAMPPFYDEWITTQH